MKNRYQTPESIVINGDLLHIHKHGMDRISRTKKTVEHTKNLSNEDVISSIQRL